jgi:acyl-coenzyme A thioesterase PaaI-like protein
MSDFNTNLGLRPGAEPGTIELETRDEHLVAPDTVHFAVLTTMAEVAAAGAVGAPVVPANVTVSLLARAGAGPLAARGKLIKRGRRLAVAEGEVRQRDRLVAKATVTFALTGG